MEIDFSSEAQHFDKDLVAPLVNKNPKVKSSLKISTLRQKPENNY
jgi:hypothetical protein